jgi:hypothetical protein
VTPAAPDTALDAALLEGQGLLQLAIVGPENIDSLDAANGEHSCILSVLQHVDAVLGDASADQPALSCLLCADPMWRDWPPLAVAVFNADVPSPLRRSVGRAGQLIRIGRCRRRRWTGCARGSG